jgi:hypothetical protein
MSTAVELWIYADEAMRWSRLAGNERDRSALSELSRRWRKAAYAARFRDASNVINHVNSSSPATIKLTQYPNT